MLFFVTEKKMHFMLQLISVVVSRKMAALSHFLYITSTFVIRGFLGSRFLDFMVWYLPRKQ